LRVPSIREAEPSAESLGAHSHSHSQTMTILPYDFR
jgi:hypothetical protein